MGEQSYITRFRAQEEGFRQLTTELRQMGTIGDDAFNRIESASRRAGGGLTHVDTTSRRLQTGFSGLVRGATLLTGALAGIGIGFGLGEILGDIAEFEKSFNNVRTLVDESAVSTDRLRQELLALPPVLGSSRELAEGLYQALSAGVEPAQAVRFVGQAAQFAAAALVETNTAVDVATTVLNAYGESAGQADRVFSTLFETIRRGKTTGEELSASLGPVIPLAAELGISFDDVAAALATLTAGGLRTNTAVDALKSQFSQLIQNAQKFRDVGIDVREVIGESGLTGLLERLRDTTGGNAEAVRELVSDVQGLIATLALTGPQFDTFKRNVQGIGAADDSDVAAFAKQTEGLAAAWDELGNTWDRVIQQGSVLSDVFETITRTATKALEPFTADKLTRLRTELAQLTEDLRIAEKQFFPSLLAVTPEDIRQRIQAVQEEIENLSLAQAGDSGPAIQARIEQELEAERVAAIQKAQLARVAAEQQAEIERKAADEREAKARATQQKLDAIEERHAAETIRIFGERNNQLERLNQERIRDADNAARTIRGFQRDLAEDELREQERVQNDLARIRDRARQEQQRAEERAERDAARLAERQREERLRPYVELGNDIAETLSDALVEGFTADSIFDAIERTWADFLSRTLQATVFDPFIEGLAEDISGALTPTGAPGGGGTPSFRTIEQEVAALTPEATTQGGQLASQSQGVSGAGLTSIYILGASAAGQFIAEQAGADIAASIIGGAGQGAAAGAVIGSVIPGIGTAIGAAAGAVIGAAAASIPILFGGGGESRAQLRSGLTAPAQSEASDRFVAESEFGFISFTTDGTKRFDAAKAAKFVAEIDNAIADLLTDRQDAVVTAVLGSSGPSEVRSGGSQEDVVSQIVFDRITAAIDALAPGLSEEVFGAYEPSAENIANIAETAEQLLAVLGVVDEFRQPSAPLNDAALAIQALDEQFDSLAEAARRFGLEEEERIIRQAQAQERAQLTTDFNEQIRREELGITDPLALELELHEERRQAALDNARTLGADLNAVESRYAAERLAILERFEGQALTAESLNQQARRDTLRLTDPRQLELELLEERRQAALTQARELGADINLIEQQFALERIGILQRFADQAVSVLTAGGFNEQIRNDTLRITDPRRLELELLEKQRQTSLAQAREVGADINAVEELFALKRLGIIERFATQAVATITRGEVEGQSRLAAISLTDPRRAALIGLEERHQAALKQAREVGANINLIERQFALERIGIIQQFADQAASTLTAGGFNEKIRLELLGINDPFQLEIHRLNQRRQAALEQARLVGGSINLVEKRFAAERIQIIERSLGEIQEVVRRDFSAIDDFITSFGISEASGLTLTQRAGNAHAAFQQALAGDDVNDAVRIADQLLQLERERLGSTVQFFDLQEEVFKALEAFRDQGQREDEFAIAKQQLERQQQIANIMQEQTLQLTASHGTQQEMLRSLRSLNRANDLMLHQITRQNLNAAGVS